MPPALTLSIALLPAVPALPREQVLSTAAEFATHPWTMGAENQTASCSSDYVSDYSPGQSYRGLPYDWGGWVTTAEYDAALAEGLGAGSHSWHGVLSCTVGVDCSGFVSQAWHTDQKYGTSTFYQVSTEIPVEELARGDALNDAGSHIVLFTYQTAAGLPVHYESAGDLVSVDSDQGWSAFSGYVPIRYDEIEDGAETGTISAPIEILAFPYEDLRWTAGAASDALDRYACAPELDESGPEQLYRLQVEGAGTLSLRLSDDVGVDVDLHVLSGPSGADCLARDDSELSVELAPGTWWIAADTYVGGGESPGPYLLTASFTGTLGEPEEEPGTEDSGSAGDSGAAPDGGGLDEGEAEGGAADAGATDGAGEAAPGRVPGQAVALEGLGGTCAAAPGAWTLLGLLGALLGLRRTACRA